MATIKEIIDEFCDRVNIPRQASYVGNTSPAARQYLSLLKKIGDNLRNRPFTWPQLKRTHTFNTATDQTKYQLPGDFYRLLNSTQWDQTNQWPMLGPISDANMVARQINVIESATLKAYRVIGPTGYLFNTNPYSQRSAGTIEIDPPGADNTTELFLGYYSCNYIGPRDWVASTAYTAGDIRSGDGYVYRANANGTSGSNRPDWSSGSDSDGNMNWTVYKEPYLIVASNTQLNDTDFVLFDDDLMLEGLEWAWAQAKRQPFEALRGDWERKVLGAQGRMNGVVKVNMCDTIYDTVEFPKVPDGSWSI